MSFSMNYHTNFCINFFSCKCQNLLTTIKIRKNKTKKQKIKTKQLIMWIYKNRGNLLSYCIKKNMILIQKNHNPPFLNTAKKK